MLASAIRCRHALSLLVNCFLDLYITTRDRTPVTSDNESCQSDDLDNEDGERLVVPPNVTCVIRDSDVTDKLPVILNATVGFYTLVSSGSGWQTNLPLSNPRRS